MSNFKKLIVETQGEPEHYHNELMKKIYLKLGQIDRDQLWITPHNTSSKIDHWIDKGKHIAISQDLPLENGDVKVWYSSTINPDTPENSSLKSFKAEDINGIIRYARELVSKYGSFNIGDWVIKRDYASKGAGQVIGVDGNMYDVKFGNKIENIPQSKLKISIGPKFMR